MLPHRATTPGCGMEDSTIDKGDRKKFQEKKAVRRPIGIATKHKRRRCRLAWCLIREEARCRIVLVDPGEMPREEEQGPTKKPEACAVKWDQARKRLSRLVMEGHLRAIGGGPSSFLERRTGRSGAKD
jgi:hypothetical protein